MTPKSHPHPRVRISAALPHDLDALVALEQAAFAGDRLSRRQYARHLASASACLLKAQSGSRLLGSAVVFLRRGSAVARLYSIAVAADARGYGVGAALLAAAERAAGRRAARCLRLEVRSDNAAAIRLYESRGYRRIGRHVRYYEDGADAWRYEKVLGAPRPARAAR